MNKKTSKLISILLCFCFLSQQVGFAQVAAELDLSSHFTRLHNSLTVDKFRPIHLRYLSYDNLNNNFKLLLDKGDSLKGLSPSKLSDTTSKGTVPEEELKSSTQELLNYFFIGISLPNDSFWVNLRPGAADYIIDPYLAQTDVGKILLEADLQLKKDTALATSPQTVEGKAYWDKLYKKAEELFGTESITIPTLTRPWIVPGEIIIRESTDNAYIYKATLKVMLEQDYLAQGKGIGTGIDYSFKDERLKKLNEYSSELIRETIIPKLTKDINTSKRYASLRQVYYSLILAQWFKARFYGKGGLYSYLIDKRELNNLTSKTPWDKQTYFKQYQASFQKGEYNLKEPVYTPQGQVIRGYMSGGIALGPTVSSAITSGKIPAQDKDLPTGIRTSSPAMVAGGGTSGSPFTVMPESAVSLMQQEPKSAASPTTVSSPIDEQVKTGLSPAIDVVKAKLADATRNNPILYDIVYTSPEFEFILRQAGIKGEELKNYKFETMKFLQAMAEGIILGEKVEENRTAESKPNSGQKILVEKLPELGIDSNKVFLFRLTDQRKSGETKPEDWWSSEISWVIRGIGGHERAGKNNVLLVTSLYKLTEASPSGLSTTQDDTILPGIKRVGNYPINNRNLVAQFAYSAHPSGEISFSILDSFDKNEQTSSAASPVTTSSSVSERGFKKIISVILIGVMLFGAILTFGVNARAADRSPAGITQTQPVAGNIDNRDKERELLLEEVTSPDSGAHGIVESVINHNPKALANILRSIGIMRTRQIESTFGVIDDNGEQETTDIFYGEAASVNLPPELKTKKVRVLVHSHPQQIGQDREITIFPYASPADSAVTGISLDDNAIVIILWQSGADVFATVGTAKQMNVYFGNLVSGALAILKDYSEERDRMLILMEGTGFKVYKINKDGSFSVPKPEDVFKALSPEKPSGSSPALESAESAASPVDTPQPENDLSLAKYRVLIDDLKTDRKYSDYLSLLPWFEEVVKVYKDYKNDSDREKFFASNLKETSEINDLLLSYFGNDKEKLEEALPDILGTLHIMIAMDIYIKDELVLRTEEGYRVITNWLPKGHPDYNPDNLQARIEPLGMFQAYERAKKIKDNPSNQINEKLLNRVSIPKETSALKIAQGSININFDEERFQKYVDQGIIIPFSNGGGYNIITNYEPYKPGDEGRTSYFVHVNSQEKAYEGAEERYAKNPYLRSYTPHTLPSGRGDIPLAEFAASSAITDIKQMQKKLSQLEGFPGLKAYSDLINGLKVWFKYGTDDYNKIENLVQLIEKYIPYKVNDMDDSIYKDSEMSDINRFFNTRLPKDFANSEKNLKDTLPFIPQTLTINADIVKLKRDIIEIFKDKGLVAEIGDGTYKVFTGWGSPGHDQGNAQLVSASMGISEAYWLAEYIWGKYKQNITSIGEKFTDIEKKLIFAAVFNMQDSSEMAITLMETDISIEKYGFEISEEKIKEYLRGGIGHGELKLPAELEAECRKLLELDEAKAVLTEEKPQEYQAAMYSLKEKYYLLKLLATPGQQAPLTKEKILKQNSVKLDPGTQITIDYKGPVTIMLPNDEAWQLKYNNNRGYAIFQKEKTSEGTKTLRIPQVGGKREPVSLEDLVISCQGERGEKIVIQRGPVNQTKGPVDAKWEEASSPIQNTASSSLAEETFLSASSSPISEELTDIEKKLMVAMVLTMQGNFEKALGLTTGDRPIEEYGFIIDQQWIKNYLGFYGQVRDEIGPTEFRSKRQRLLEWVKVLRSQEKMREYVAAMYSLRDKYDLLVQLASGKHRVAYRKSKMLNDGDREEREYQGPIKIVLAPNAPGGGITLWIYKTTDIPDSWPVKDEINRNVPYFIIKEGGSAGEFKALREERQETLILGRQNAGRFKDLTNSWISSWISRLHVSISRRGDTIIIQDGVITEDGQIEGSTNGIFVEWTVIREERRAAEGLLKDIKKFVGEFNATPLPADVRRKDLVLLNGRTVDESLQTIQSALLNGEISDTKMEDFKAELENIREEMEIILGFIKRFGVPDYRKRLGVGRDDNDDQVKSVYRKLLLEFHPDKYANGYGPHQISQQVAKVITVLIIEAHNKLTSSPIRDTASSPLTEEVSVKDPSNPVTNKVGGIDLRNLPSHTTVQQMPLGTVPLGALADSHLRGQSLSMGAVLSKEELKEEWARIENMLAAGLIPSSERIKDYLISCCYKQEINQEIDKVLSCIADILRLEEEQVASTDSALKEVLILLESDKPADQMQLALAQITAEPKEPKTVEQ